MSKQSGGDRQAIRKGAGFVAALERYEAAVELCRAGDSLRELAAGGRLSDWQAGHDAERKRMAAADAAWTAAR